MQPKSKRSFTLIELLIVLIIIGVIAALIIPQFNVMVWNSRGAEAKSNMGAISRAMVAFYEEKGELPCTYSGSYIPLEFLITIPKSKYWRYIYLTVDPPPPPSVAGVAAIPVNTTPDEVTALITGAPFANTAGAPEGAIVVHYMYFRTSASPPGADEELEGLAFGNYKTSCKKGTLTKGGIVVYTPGL